MEKVTKAKAGLIILQPFFATILLGQKIVESEAIPTMATDGEQIIVNPKWIEPLTLSEVTFVLAHEVLHCVFDHMGRRGEKDPEKWNIAADYIINDLLIKQNIGAMPKVGLHDPALVLRGGGTAEGVYNCLGGSPPPPPKGSNGKPKPGQKPGSQPGNGPGQSGKKPGNGPGHPGQSPGGFPGPGQPGGALDSLIDSAKDEAGRAQKLAERKVKIIQAKNAAKMAGQLSAEMERVIDDMTRAKVDWKSVLRNFLTEKTKSHYSFAKPKRRFLSEDLILPSLVGEKMGSVAVAVDCSGSINDEILAKFGAEINGIIEDMGLSEINIFYFDSSVLRLQTHRPEEMGILKLSPIGGGGTRFSPIWEAVKKLEAPPIAMVVLTDLICHDFGHAPDYPVLWCTTDSTAAPFGEIVLLEE